MDKYKNVTDNFTKLIKDFVRDCKPIVSVGYGILPLLQIFEKNVWLFKKYNITGIPIVEECKELYFY